ncbi:MAG: hypothetical protein AAAB35_17905 [Phyllobacterium sp.]|uniref:hypothetical protein n=1 Tax=Phyllobacterium sp. TaxID=1871046 RepID=UPI0030F18641
MIREGDVPNLWEPLEAGHFCDCGCLSRNKDQTFPLSCVFYEGRLPGGICMLTRFKLARVLCSAFVAAALVATSIEITFDGRYLSLHPQSAWADDGGNNGGKGSGNGGGKGAGNSGGNGAGNSGGKGAGNSGDKGAGNSGDKGAGNSGGNGAGNSNGGNNGSGGGGNGKGNNGKGAKSDNASQSGDEKGTTVNQPVTRENVEVDGSSIEVRHTNGMSERIEAGRYTMTDAKGRTIINRPATNADQSRLQSFAR